MCVKLAEQVLTSMSSFLQKLRIYLLSSQSKLGTQLPLKTEVGNKSYSALQDLNQLENSI